MSYEEFKMNEDIRREEKRKELYNIAIAEHNRGVFNYIGLNPFKIAALLALKVKI